MAGAFALQFLAQGPHGGTHLGKLLVRPRDGTLAIGLFAEVRLLELFPHGSDGLAELEDFAMGRCGRLLQALLLAGSRALQLIAHGRDGVTQHADFGVSRDQGLLRVGRR